MKFSKKYLLVIPVLALAGVAAAGSVSAASAQGGFGGGRGFGGGMGIQDPDKFVEHLTQEASALGISLAEMKTYWSQGKTVKDIATEKGITQEQLKVKMEAAAEAKATANLKALVDKGIITQAQADARLTVMKEMKTKMAEKMKNRPQMKRGAKIAPPANTTAPTQS